MVYLHEISKYDLACNASAGSAVEDQIVFSNSLIFTGAGPESGALMKYSICSTSGGWWQVAFWTSKARLLPYPPVILSEGTPLGRDGIAYCSDHSHLGYSETLKSAGVVNGDVRPPSAEGSWDQAAHFRAWLCTGAHKNPATCGTNQGN